MLEAFIFCYIKIWVILPKAFPFLFSIIQYILYLCCRCCCYCCIYYMVFVISQHTLPWLRVDRLYELQKKTLCRVSLLLASCENNTMKSHQSQVVSFFSHWMQGKRQRYKRLYLWFICVYNQYSTNFFSLSLYVNEPVINWLSLIYCYC